MSGQLVPEGFSRCSRCKKVKPAGEFARSKIKKNGCASWCKVCFTSYQYAEDPERRRRLLAQSAEWSKKHRRHPRVLKHAMPDVKPDSVTCAYLAGLIEAEGSFTIRPGNVRYAPRISIYNNHLRLLEWVKEKIGGCLTEAERGDFRPPEHQLAFINHPHVKSVCELILPYMTLKRRQCEILIEACEVTPQIRRGLRDELMALNKKGVRLESYPRTSSVQPQDFIDPEQWAYLAGWIDGDGSVALQPQYFGETKYLYPWIIVYSAKPEPLMHLNGIFGGNVKFREGRGGRITPQGQLGFFDKKLVGFIARGVLPYMVDKKRQIEIAIEASERDSASCSDLLDELKKLNERCERPVMTMTVCTLADYAAGRTEGKVYEIRVPREKKAEMQMFSLAEYAAKVV